MNTDRRDTMAKQNRLLVTKTVRHTSGTTSEPLRVCSFSDTY